MKLPCFRNRFQGWAHSLLDASRLPLHCAMLFQPYCGVGQESRKLMCVLLFLMMLPRGSIFVFLAHHLNPSITTSWWSELFLTRNMVWLFPSLSVALLLRVRESRGGDAELS